MNKGPFAPESKTLTTVPATPTFVGFIGESISYNMQTIQTKSDIMFKSYDN